MKYRVRYAVSKCQNALLRQYSTPGPYFEDLYFLKKVYFLKKNKATYDKISYGSDQKCSKELKNYSFTSVEIIVVKLQ